MRVAALIDEVIGRLGVAHDLQVQGRAEFLNVVSGLDLVLV